MINPANSAAVAVSQPAQDYAPGRKVLTMVHNDRMAGSVPAWVDASTQKQKIEQDLAAAQSGTPAETFKAALAYNDTPATQVAEEEFGFGDLIDMINPLQHIPIIGHLYRSLTGDEIKPIGKIIGGAAFGGIAGAAGGLVSVIVEKETGKDPVGNALAFLGNRETPAHRNETPEETLNRAAKAAPGGAALPASLLAFAGPEINPYKIY